MDLIRRPFKMLVTGTLPERIAYDAAQMKWTEVHLVSNRKGTPLWNTPGIIHHICTPSIDLIPFDSLVIFEECHSLNTMMGIFIRGRKRGISVIVVDVVTLPRWLRMNADYRVFTSAPTGPDRNYIQRFGNADFVLNRSGGRVIMAEHSVNWDVIAFLVNLAELRSQIEHMALKQFDCGCPRPPVMEVLTRNYNLWR